VDGKPLHMSWMCAPDAVDWDGDGDLDLITSDETSGVFLIENVGTRSLPRLAAPKPISDASGRPIKSPFQPVEEMSFFKKDYAPTPIASLDGIMNHLLHFISLRDISPYGQNFPTCSFDFVCQLQGLLLRPVVVYCNTGSLSGKQICNCATDSSAGGLVGSLPKT
jgi:hypothetical protein